MGLELRTLGSNRTLPRLSLQAPQGLSILMGFTAQNALCHLLWEMYF